MPRVSINKKKYTMNDFSRWLMIRMKEEKISQKELGELLNISQQSFSYARKNNSFNYEQMIVIFHELKATDEEILKIMKY